MASRQAKSNIQKSGRQSLVPENQGKRPQGIKKQRPQISRKSARLEEIQRRQERTVSQERNTEPKHSQRSPTSNTPGKKILSACLQDNDRKRKRAEEPKETSNCPSSKRVRKRTRTSVADSDFRDTFCETADGVTDSKTNPIKHWIWEGKWPQEFFEQGRKDSKKDSWYGKYWVPEMNMNHLLAKKKSSSSLRGKQSEAGSAAPSSTTPSDQKPREAKSVPYTRPSYTTVLATKGSFMDKSDLDIIDASKSLCRILLEKEQSVSQDSLFRDDLFENACRKMRERNEARVIQDITRLIVPSAETLATYGATHLDPLIESVNEGWNSAIPFYGPRPQPDYSVGFGRSAFTDDQLEKLKPFVGEVTDTFTSYFMATWQMFFPFLTCEVKCGAAALDVADRQNAHSTTIAMRAVVELLKLVGREKEVDREILAFSISHDHRTVRIYGHYALVDGKNTTFYRHPIRTFDFTELDGKDKWTAYKFTRNVYDIWMPTHFKRICSAIDQIPPDVNFDVSQSELQFSQLSRAESGPVMEDDDSQPSQPSYIGSADVTPTTSFTEQTQVSKKPRKKR